MKSEEIRALEPAAIMTEVEKLRRELLELRCKVALGEDVRPHRVKEIKKEIARMLTIAGEKAAAAEEGVNA
ncbi:MAG: 50S ribosomal protein L29 [Planctomycetaceae bacterium]|nr:50S ribosomal protein L29 [Planctomycetaceae bacterium]